MIAVEERPDPGAQIAGLIFAVLLLDPDMVVREANPAAEDLLHRSARRLVGERLLDVIGLDDERVAHRLGDADARLTVRGMVMRCGERAMQVNVTVSPLATHPGWRVMTFSEVGQGELGDEGRDETTLRAPSILAHEIKNPLAAIRGAGQLVARKLDEKDRPLAAMISAEVDRIARLVDRMQRLGSERADPVEPTNLHEAIRSAIATVRAAGGGGVELVEEFDPSLPPVLASRDALEQVLINLVTNARDACSGGEEPRVVIRTRFVSGLVSNLKLGRAIRLPIEVTVSDNGPGVDPSLRDHVFEPFVTSKSSGQGLGLALVRKLVRDMDGRIGHQRDERAGLTHFRIHLPLAREEGEPA
ncbi:two-component system sensor histidine kinase NtrB [Pelagerythrobacter marinus]|uniref:two-component system sensor histidine kinase NtrB n=1 Tax=Pelagerythrobacter marinus TaxID=538382 RepID=UPI002AC960B4|nr:ATP-binding protein [Pelagerythrobacter marinus]WPZ08177.1 ATP-binding protein [Pelagerythrobacter marinus]